MSKKHFVLRALAVAAFAVAATSSQAANLFQNGGFESGSFTGWDDAGSAAVTSAQAHTGSYSFAGYTRSTVSQTFAATATSDITEFSFWGKRDGGLYNLVVLSYSDNSVDQFMVNTLGSGDHWTKVDLTSSLAIGKSLLGFQIFGTTPGPSYLDDFTLTTAAVPEPSTYALLALGLAGIGAVARRRKA